MRVSQDPLIRPARRPASPARFAHPHAVVLAGPDVAATGTPSGRKPAAAATRLDATLSGAMAAPHLPQPQRLGQGPGRRKVDRGGRDPAAAGLGDNPPPDLGTPHCDVEPPQADLAPDDVTVERADDEVQRQPRSRRSGSPAIQRRAAPGDGVAGTGLADHRRIQPRAARAATSRGSSRHARSRMPRATSAARARAGQAQRQASFQADLGRHRGEDTVHEPRESSVPNRRQDDGLVDHQRRRPLGTASSS